MAIPKLYDYTLPVGSELPENRVNWAFEPQHAALLIHDMQQYFVNFWPQDSQLVKQVIDNIAALRRYCKQHGIPVFYTAQPSRQSDGDRALLNDMWGPGLNQHPEQQAVVQALAPDADDTVLVKWRYSAFCRSPLQDILQRNGRDQLIICGVYAHIGCMTTAVDAFMRNIKPFLVADAVADFSRDEHLLTLRYTAGCIGRVVMLADLLPAIGSIALLRQQIIPLLDKDSGDIGNDENLTDYGLDSVQIMALATRWRKIRADVDFIALAKSPTIASWWQLLSQGKG